MKVSELYLAITDWARSAGAKGIGALPGCWTGEIGGLEVAINGHCEPTELPDKGSGKFVVPPFEAAVFRDGWLIALVSPAAGVVIGGDNAEAGLVAHFRSSRPESAA